jgi:hypothetical protein
MNEMVEPLRAPWWRRLWAHPGFHGVVRMIGEVLAFVLFALAVGWALRKLVPLPPIKFEAMPTEEGPTVFLRPGGNLLEVDWPDVTTLDRARIPELKKLADFAEQTGDALNASLYLDRPGFNPAAS